MSAYAIGIRREIEAADLKYGAAKDTAPLGRIAGAFWWLAFRVTKSLDRGVGRDRWRRVLLEEVAEAFAAKVVAKAGTCEKELLACELTQVAATAHRWLRQLESEGVTARQSWPPEYSR